MEMVQPRKSASQASTTTTSKGKSTAARGTVPADAYPFHLDVHIKEVGESTLPRLLHRRQGPTYMKTGFPLKASSSKYEYKEAALERDAVACVQNQLVTQIDIL